MKTRNAKELIRQFMSICDAELSLDDIRWLEDNINELIQREVKKSLTGMI